MKTKLFILLSTIVLISCSENQSFPPVDGSEVEVMTKESSQKFFAKILSKALYKSLDLRKFVKEKALQEFDNDNDVFYPFVKDEIVSNGQTFREILLSYCEDKDKYMQMEKVSPLLNILVPDLSIFTGFNAGNWDINDKSIAVIAKLDDDNTIFEDGEPIGILPTTDIPGFPCLVVKNNERMKIVNQSTRTTGIEYEFIADAYNGSKKSQTRHSTFDINNLETPVETDCYLPISELDPSIIKAWDEFKNIPKASQRDYIYYNIDKSNQSGELNHNFRETLYKFKINPEWLQIISDQLGKDPSDANFVQRKRYATNEEIIKNMWTEGKFEIVFETYLGTDKSPNAMSHKIPFSLSASKLWSVKNVHVNHQNGSFWRHSKNTYTIDVNSLQPKWVYAQGGPKENSIFIQPWDLYVCSTTINIYVSEIDDGQTIKETRSVVNQYLKKFDVNAEISGEISGIKGSLKMGYGYSETTTNSSSLEVSTSTGSDNLGNLIFNFFDPIILDDSKKDTKGYKINSVKSGNAVEAIIIPKRII